MSLNKIQAFGPHIQGFIRFASDGVGEDLRQLDHFEVLSRVHEETVGVEGRKLKTHPIASSLASDEGKLKVIPIKLICDKPSNNLSARYEAYHPEMKRAVCAGDGTSAQRANLGTASAEQVECRGPDACTYANSGDVRCALSVRLKAQIDGQDDEFSVFEFQSRSINSFMTISAKLEMMYTMFGKRLRGVPLQLAVEERSSSESHFESFFVASVALREGIAAEDVPALLADFDANKSGLFPAEMEMAIESMAGNARLHPGAGEGTVLVFKPFARPNGKASVPVRSVTSAISNLVAQAVAAKTEMPTGHANASEESAVDMAMPTPCAHGVVAETDIEPEETAVKSVVADPLVAVAGAKIEKRSARSEETPPIQF